MITEIHLAEPCLACRRQRSGVANGRTGAIAGRLPGDCRDRDRCQGEIAAALRAELARGTVSQPGARGARS